MIKYLTKRLQNQKPKDKYILKPIKDLKDTGLNIYGVQLVFILIAIMYASFLFFGKGIMQGDITFHYLRLRDVDLALIHGEFPQFNLYTNMPIGIAINTFYPYILFLPVILLTEFFKPIIVLAILLFLITLIGLEVCYYCFHHILRFTQFTSFLIATFQWISSTTFGTEIRGADYGSLGTIILFPIVITGWIMWIEHGKWKMMAIGMCGIVLFNIPTTIILITVLGLLTIMQWKRLTIHNIYIGIKATIVSILILTVYWLPIVVITNTNHIFIPNQLDVKTDPDTLLPTSWVSVFTPLGYSLWDLLELLAIILVIIYWKKINTFIKQITLLSIGLLLINIKAFKIQYFFETYTPLKLIQYTQRFNLITHFLLIISLVTCLNIIYEQVKHKQLFVNIWYPEIIIYACLLSLLGINECVANRIASPITNKSINDVTVKDAGENIAITNERVGKVYTHTTPTTLHTIETTPRYLDYLPDSVLNNHIRNQMSYKTYHYDNNGMNFKEEHNKQLLLPFVIYHTQKYYITDNKKPLQYHYYHHYIKANLHKGENRIRVKAPIMWYRYVGILCSIVGILGLCYEPKKNKKQKC